MIRVKTSLMHIVSEEPDTVQNLPAKQPFELYDILGLAPYEAICIHVILILVLCILLALLSE